MHGSCLLIANRPTRGEDFRVGDQVRFKVTVHKPGHVLIVGVEEDGNSYMAHPSRGSQQSRPITETEAVLLPDAIELDDSPRTEWLHLVHCVEEFSRKQLTIGKDSPDKISIPKGCSSDTFEMRKAK